MSKVCLCNIPLQVKCSTNKISFSEPQRGGRPNEPYYYIQICSCRQDYYTTVLMESKYDEYITVESKDNRDIPIIEVYYPYNYPAIIQLNWYNDTYSGTVNALAVNTKGWYKIPLDYDSKAGDSNDIDFDDVPDLSYSNRDLTKVYLRLDNSKLDIINKVDKELKKSNSPLYKEFHSKIKLYTYLQRKFD